MPSRGARSSGGPVPARAKEQRDGERVPVGPWCVHPPFRCHREALALPRGQRRRSPAPRTGGESGGGRVPARPSSRGRGERVPARSRCQGALGARRGGPHRQCCQGPDRSRGHGQERCRGAACCGGQVPAGGEEQRESGERVPAESRCPRSPDLRWRQALTLPRGRSRRSPAPRPQRGVGRRRPAGPRRQEPRGERVPAESRGKVALGLARETARSPCRQGLDRDTWEALRDGERVPVTSRGPRRSGGRVPAGATRRPSCGGRVPERRRGPSGGGRFPREVAGSEFPRGRGGRAPSWGLPRTGDGSRGLSAGGTSAEFLRRTSAPSAASAPRAVAQLGADSTARARAHALSGWRQGGRCPRSEAGSEFPRGRGGRRALLPSQATGPAATGQW